MRQGEVAPRDIVAPQTTEIVDERRTEELRQRVAATVPLVYGVDPQVEFEVRQELEVFFSELNAIREGTDSSPSPVVMEQFQNEWGLPEGRVMQLVTKDETTYQRIKGSLRSQIDIFLERPVREEEIEELSAEIAVRLDNIGLEPEGKELVVTLFQTFFRPNAVIDPVLTEAERERVLAEVRPVRRLIQRGQTIVRRGDIVTEEHMEVLRALGLSGEGQEYVHLGVLAVIVFFTMVFDWLFLRKFVPQALEKITKEGLDSIKPKIKANKALHMASRKPV